MKFPRWIIFLVILQDRCCHSQTSATAAFWGEYRIWAGLGPSFRSHLSATAHKQTLPATRECTSDYACSHFPARTQKVDTSEKSRQALADSPNFILIKKINGAVTRKIQQGENPRPFKQQKHGQAERDRNTRQDSGCEWRHVNYYPDLKRLTAGVSAA